MKKHLLAYGFLVLSIAGMAWLNYVTKLELVHQRAWLEDSRQLELGVLYMHFMEHGEEAGKSKLLCSLAVHSDELRAWQDELENISGHHHSKKELSHSIDRTFDFIKGLPNAKNIEQEDFWSKCCTTMSLTSGTTYKDVTTCSSSLGPVGPPLDSKTVGLSAP